MIPIEKIASGTMQNILLYVSIIGLLLVVASVIRLKVGFLRKAFIPASLLAGLIGMALGPHMLKIIPTDMMNSIGALPAQMIIIVFACMQLGRKRQDTSNAMGRNLISSLGWSYINSFLQVGLVCILCVVFFVPIFNVNPMFASVFEIGFAGGHGTAGGMVDVFNRLGWADGSDVAKTTATIGLLSGIFGGIAIINYGVRKNYTKVITNISTTDNTKEMFSETEREPAAYATVNQDVVEPFAFHFGIIGISILIGWIIIWTFKVMFNYGNLPLFPFAMIGGWILNGIIQRTTMRDLLDRNTFQCIQGMALEILVVAAMASISIPIVLFYWAPLLIGSIVVLGMITFMFFWLCPRIYDDNWFEHGIIRFGVFTGVAAVGYMLLRIADPKMETDAAQVYAISTPFTSPFTGGGLITVAYPLLIVKFGVLTTGIVLCSSALLIILLLRFFCWNSNPKMVQR